MELNFKKINKKYIFLHIDRNIIPEKKKLSMQVQVSTYEGKYVSTTFNYNIMNIRCLIISFCGKKDIFRYPITFRFL